MKWNVLNCRNQGWSPSNTTLLTIYPEESSVTNDIPLAKELLSKALQKEGLIDWTKIRRCVCLAQCKRGWDWRSWELVCRCTSGQIKGSRDREGRAKTWTNLVFSSINYHFWFFFLMLKNSFSLDRTVYLPSKTCISKLSSWGGWNCFSVCDVSACDSQGSGSGPLRSINWPQYSPLAA